eukprot:s5005_g4.t1
MSDKIEAELMDLMTVTPGEKSLRHKAQRTNARPSKLDLLEIYCEKDSNLTTVVNSMGLTAKRFTREDGDLSTAAGREKLLQPDHCSKLHGLDSQEIHTRGWGSFDSGRQGEALEID